MNIASPHSRRKFLGQLSTGLSSISVMDLNSKIEGAQTVTNAPRGLLETTHIPARAKRVIYLFQSGGPSQLDLYDHKPELKKRQGNDLPDSVRKGQRLTGMTAGQSQFPIAASGFDFKQHGQSGHWMSSALPHLSGMADDMCMIKTMHTEAINHDPAITYFQTGFQLS